MDEPLLVTVAEVAKRLGLDPVALTTQQADTITDAILAAQGAAEGYLNRTVVPVEATFEGARPAWGAPDLDDESAWPDITLAADDEWTLVSRTQTGDTWTVVASVGLDGSQHRPIVTYIKAHAVELVRDDPVMGAMPRKVASVSREGQSLSFVQGSVAEG